MKEGKPAEQASPVFILKKKERDQIINYRSEEEQMGNAAAEEALTQMSRMPQMTLKVDSV